MHTFDLDVEDGIRVERDVIRFFDIFSKTNLIVAFNFAKLFQHGGVIFEFEEFFQLSSIVDITIADFFCQQSSQLRIGLVQPAAVCNAVGHVLELLGHFRVEIVENSLL